MNIRKYHKMNVSSKNVKLRKNFDKLVHQKSIESNYESGPMK